jgi:hypothetical protein
MFNRSAECGKQKSIDMSKQIPFSQYGTMQTGQAIMRPSISTYSTRRLTLFSPTA